MNKIYGIGDEEELANDLQEEMSKMIPLSAIKEIREDISANNLGLDMDKATLEELIVIDLTRKAVIELIDRKVKEYTK